MPGYACLFGRRHARPRPGPDGDQVWRGTGEKRALMDAADRLLEFRFLCYDCFFLTCFSAPDVPESPVPERQRFWRARVLGQVQRSRGERSTLLDSSSENFCARFRGADRQPRGALATTPRPSLFFRPAQTNSFVQDHAFVAIATAVSSGLWWLQNSYVKSYDISDTLGIKESAFGGGENS